MLTQVKVEGSFRMCLRRERNEPRNGRDGSGARLATPCWRRTVYPQFLPNPDRVQTQMRREQAESGNLRGLGLAT